MTNAMDVEFRLTDESAIHAIEAWRRIPKHCNIVGLREAFTNKSFGDDCAPFLGAYKKP